MRILANITLLSWGAKTFLSKVRPWGLGLAILITPRVLAEKTLEKHFYVDQFIGATDGEKINAAFKEMVSVEGPKVLHFQPREYLIESKGSDGFEPVIGAVGLRDLTIAGHGACWVAQNQLQQAQGYFFKQSRFKNLTLENLNLTYRPRPFVQGRILQVEQSKNKVLLQLDKNFSNWPAINLPSANAKLWCRVGQQQNPAWAKAHSPAWLPASFAPLTQAQKDSAESKVWVHAGAFDLTKTLNGVYNWEVGDPMVIWKRGAQDALVFEEGEGLVLKNITLDSALHYGIKLRGIVQARLEQCDVIPVTGGMISGCADGIDVQQSRDISIVHCKISSNGDDGISLLNNAQHGFNGEFHEKKLAPPYPETNENILISQNEIQGSNRNGMLILASNVIISRNNLHQVRQYGLKFCGNHTQILDNIFSEVGSFAAYRHISDELNTGVICSDDWLQTNAVINNNRVESWHNMPAMMLKSLNQATIKGNWFDLKDENRLNVKPFNPTLSQLKTIVVTSGNFMGKNIPCDYFMVENNTVMKTTLWPTIEKSFLLEEIPHLVVKNNQMAVSSGTSLELP